MIHISLSHIADGALAASALQSSTAKTHLLNRDDIPALRRTACDILATCLLAIAPMVLETDIDTIDPTTDDVVTIQLNINPRHEPAARRAIEAAATAALLGGSHPDTTANPLRTLAINLAPLALMRLPRTFRPTP